MFIDEVSLGVITEKDEEGRVEKIYRRVEGVLEGECVTFYPSGEVKSRLFYEGGLLHGPSCFYSPEGRLLSKTIFTRDKAQGRAEQYYISGRLYAELFYEEGKLQGIQKYFYETGEPRTIMSYDKGILEGEVLLFWPGSAIKRRCFFSRGVKTGREEIFNKAGTLLDEGDFVNGSPVGTHGRRYPNGMLRQEKIYYPAGHCDTRRWDAEGRLEYEGIYPDANTFRETKFSWPEGTKQQREGMWDGERCHWK